ncbi:DUF2785 domain-containing protein [Alteromonas gilva]|uniref:DUF2785 domain-containing protein n=1 Tax=Alteromonas gilva TaxID=2987522 RepID=A0ABT5L601_9ALTE|nr:DUF2785 domain-containing protein [Alteromonas gilva]MDC8832456.1 DUF2785 domain-containing protein [Alteromonas gilva]
MSVLMGAALLSLSALATDAPKCTDDSVVLSQWQTYRAEEFSAVANNDGLLEQLYACLADPDPRLRDGIGYEGVMALFRNSQLGKAQQLAFFERLTTDLTTLTNDEHGVFLPFVVLAYSEVVRADRIVSYLSESQRQRALNAIAGYITQMQDYRGFDADTGWRHGVAHSADVLLQLALNPQLSGAQHEQIGQIIGQALQPNIRQHFYIYDEPGRLARAFAYNLLSPKVNIETWQQWLAQHSSAYGYPGWQAVFQSQDGLAQRHNKKAFFQALYATIAASEQERLVALLPSLQAALKRIP